MELIAKLIKDNIGKIIVSLGLLVLGIYIGIICQSNDNGVFVSANYPDGQSIFVIGKYKTKISDIDLGTMSEADVQLLVEKIQNLDHTQAISNNLRTMVKEAKGPFIIIPVNIKIHFTDEENITGYVVKACRNTPIFKNTIIAYDT